ncbi:MAG: hypothetical protein IPG50_31270 [Myxococcales bacterium]|nr:hypothetical protein [Myxococcales bacterium]
MLPDCGRYVELTGTMGRFVMACSGTAGSGVLRLEGATGTRLDAAPLSPGFAVRGLTVDGSTLVALGHSAIRRMRVSDGMWLDAAPISLALRTEAQTRPLVAAGKETFLVAWSDPRAAVVGEATGVLGTRFGPTGARLDSVPFVVSGGIRANLAVFDGEDFLVTAGRGCGDISRIPAATGGLLSQEPTYYCAESLATLSNRVGLALEPGGVGQRFDGSGALLSAHSSITGVFPHKQVVASDGSSFLVVFQHYGGNFEWLARTVAADGALGLIDVLSAPISNLNAAPPALLFAAGNYLLLTPGYFSPSRGYRIRPTDQANLDPSGVAIPDGVAPDNVATDGRNVFYSSISPSGEVLLHRLRASDLATLGAPLVVAVSTSSRPLSSARVGVLPFGRALVAYEAFEHEPPVNNSRVYARLVTFGQPGDACTVAEECGSILCVNGACCDAPGCGAADAGSPEAGSGDAASDATLPAPDAASPDAGIGDAPYESAIVATPVSLDASAEEPATAPPCQDSATPCGVPPSGAPAVSRQGSHTAGGGCTVGRGSRSLPFWSGLLASVALFSRRRRGSGRHRRAAFISLGVFVAAVTDLACRSTTEAQGIKAPVAKVVALELAQRTERALAFRSVNDVATAHGRLHMATVHRDGVELSFPAGALTLALQAAPARRVRLTEDGVAIREFSSFEEHIRNRWSGVEQSWRFPSRPHEAGDLVLRVRVAGTLAVEPRRSADGLVLGAGSRRVTITNGVWIDREGRKTSVDTQWDGTTIVLRVPELLLASSSYPAVLDPTISVGQALEVPDVALAAYLESATVARGTATYLVAFSDSSGDLFASRVRAADGARLEVPRRVLAREVASGQSFAPPSIVFDGTSYVVMVERGCAGYVARIRESDGELLRAGQVDSGACAYPPLGYDGVSPFFVSLAGELKRVDADLNVTTVKSLVPATGVRAVGVGGGAVLVAWSEVSPAGVREGFYQRFSAGTFATMDPAPVSLGLVDVQPGLVPFDGERFLVTGVDQQVLRSKRVAAATGDTIDLAPALRGAKRLPIAATGQFGFLQMDADGNVSLSRFDATTGAALDSTPIALPAGQLYGGAGSGPEFAVLAYPSLFRVSTTTGVASGPTEVIVHAASQGPLGLAYGPNGGLVVWVDSRGAAFALPVDRLGVPTQSSATLLGAATPGADPPQVIHDGSHFLAAWFNGTSASVRRVEADGTLVDTAPLIFGMAATPRLATTGGTTLVAAGGKAARLREGAWLDAVPLSVPKIGSLLSLGALADDFVIYSVSQCVGLVGRVGAKTGAVSGVATLPGSSCQSPVIPARDSSGNIELVALGQLGVPARYVQLRPTDFASLAGAAFTGAGTLAAFDSVSVVAVTEDADDAGLLRERWERIRRGSALPVTSSAQAGAPIDSRILGRVVSGNGERGFVEAYFRYDDDAGAPRAFTRAITFAGDGEACSVDGDCASTFCVAQVCGAPAPDASTDAGLDSADASSDAPGALEDAGPGAEAGAGSDGATLDAATVNDAQSSAVDGSQAVGRGDLDGASHPPAPPVGPVADASLATESTNASDGCTVAGTSSGPGPELALALLALRRRRRAT